VKVTLLFLFLIIVSVSVVSSQQAWTIDDCIAMAKVRSPRLQIAANAGRTAQLSQSELLTSRLPQVKASATALYAPTHGQFGYDPAITNGGELAGQVIVQQSLYDGGIRSLKYDQLSADVQQRSREAKLLDRDLVYSVRQAFIDLLHARLERDLQRESVARLLDYKRLVEQLNKGGSVGYGDVLKAKVEIAAQSIAVERADESFELSRLSLLELIGLPPDTSFVAAGELETLIPTSPDSVLLLQLTERRTSLELSIAETEFRKSLMEIQLTKRETQPTISLIGDAGVVTSGDNLRLSSSEREPVFGFSVGMTLEMPLFNWGATDLRVQQKEVLSESLRLESETVRRSLLNNAQKLSVQLTNANRRLQGVRENMQAAQDNFLLTKSKFAGGGALSLEVFTAQQLLVDVRLAELQAVADIQLLRVKIDQFLTD
jgi:outer membrane protein